MVLYPICVRVTVPGVPSVTVEPLTVDGVPPLVATLSAMYGLADKYPLNVQLPPTVRLPSAITLP